MVLSEENFLLYAMNNYSVPSCPTVDEFEDDLRVFTYIKKHLAREDVKVHLLLNHIIIAFNCFGDAALGMMFYKVDKIYWGKLITFLLFIDRMPDTIPEFGIFLSDFAIDQKILQELNQL